MRRFWLVSAVVLCLFSLTWAAEAPTEKLASSKVVSVSLFKNGLAVVKRQVKLEGAGVYRLTDVPEPVHGTFWVESNGTLEARVEEREVAAPPGVGLGLNLQDEMAGLRVTVHGKNNKNPIVGTVVKFPKKEKTDDADAEESEFDSTRRTTPASRFLLLKTDRGMSYVDYADIAAIEAEGQPEAQKIKKPVLLITAGPEAKAGMAQISYLAHGLAWAPSYKVDLSDPKKLSIEQHAVIRNELGDLLDSEVSLISGYPSVQFSNVVSPLSARQTWATFFQQLNGSTRGQSFDNSMMTQNAYAGNRVAVAVAPAVGANTGDTIDLHFHPIGKRTLKKGSSLALQTGQATAEYERIVDWTIPDNRDEWGHPTGQGRRVDPNSGDALQDDIWDALKFRNPLAFPMTSAPAMVTTAGNFSGQRSVLWTNKGEEATLRVNKALSIRARHVEYENQTGVNGANERDVVYVGGRRFRKVTVNGELRLCNHRQVDAKIIIKRHFSGDYVKGDDSPKIDLREEGVWTVNKRNELTWTLSLKPSEERTVKYQYTVLINF